MLQSFVVVRQRVAAGAADFLRWWMPAGAITGPGPNAGVIGSAHVAFNKLLKTGRTVVHWGFVPLVLYLGCSSDPKPSLIQLLLPV